MQNLDYHRRIADRGVFIEYDGLGREYYWAAVDVYWGNDAWRLNAVVELIKHGYVDQLLISQDVCFKMDLRNYGGYGYDHILVDLVPDLLRAGMAPSDLDTILITNPGRVLELRPSASAGPELADRCRKTTRPEPNAVPRRTQTQSKAAAESRLRGTSRWSFAPHWMNQQSRAATERLGATQDGILHNHIRISEGTLRDTGAFPIIETEWPALRTRFKVALPPIHDLLPEAQTTCLDPTVEWSMS